MKSKYLFLGLFVILGIFLSSGLASAIDVSVENYYPTPVEAGDYLNVWVTVSNKDVSIVNGAIMKLKVSYPFSLDPGEDKQTVINNLVGNGGFATYKLKVRVDAGAKEGENTLIIQYADCGTCDWKEKNIPITVVESQTTFDVVLQEVTSDGIYLAIANIGKNPANGITVRIPTQENFKTKLVSSSIVGNLESGDYTLVNFQILPTFNMQRPVLDKNSNKGGGKEQRVIYNETEVKELLVQVDYTDSLGVRRTILKNVQLDTAAITLLSSSMAQTFSSGNISSRTGNTGLLKNIWFWVSIILLAVIVFKVVHKRIKKKKE